MKRIVTCLLVLMLLVPAFCLGEENWKCPKCGQTNYDNFCGQCGTPRPGEISGGDTAADASGTAFSLTDGIQYYVKFSIIYDSNGKPADRLEVLFPQHFFASDVEMERYTGYRFEYWDWDRHVPGAVTAEGTILSSKTTKKEIWVKYLDLDTKEEREVTIPIQPERNGTMSEHCYSLNENVFIYFPMELEIAPDCTYALAAHTDFNASEDSVEISRDMFFSHYERRDENEGAGYEADMYIQNNRIISLRIPYYA